MAVNLLQVSIGRRVREHRIAQGLSQDELAQRARVAQSAISKLERGSTTDPGVFLLAGIASALRLPMEALVNDDDREVRVMPPAPAAGAESPDHVLVPDATLARIEEALERSQKRIDELEREVQALRDERDPGAHPRGARSA